MRRAALCLFLLLMGCRPPRPAEGPQRIVSLSPSMTETLFALGAGDRVVGVTDYCDYPPEAKSLTHTGTMLTPNYETIARLRPTLIVGEQLRNTPSDRLAALAPTRVLPWLSLTDVIASTHELGRLTDHEAVASGLAAKLQARLSAAAPSNGPRVLLVVAGEPGPFSEIWYVKRDTLHGRALEAAGGRNAVDPDVTGPPVLPLEKLISVDPDIVLLLVSVDHLSDDVRQRYVDAWKAFPLKAVKRNAVRVIDGAEVQSTGPRILAMTDRLAANLRELAGKP